MSNGWVEAMRQARYYSADTNTRFRVVARLTGNGWWYSAQPRGYQYGVTVAEVYMRATEPWKRMPA